MKTSARYAKIVEWSDEDNCYIGSAPGLIWGGCHGDDEQAVFEELCQVVEEAIEIYEAEGRPFRRRHRAVTLSTGCKVSRDRSRLDPDLLLCAKRQGVTVADIR